jgi:hypothetical protein
MPSIFGTAVPAGNGRKIEKSQRHPKDFPGGPPPQYYPGLALLNFRVRMGSGAFSAVWPLARASGCKTIWCPVFLAPQFLLVMAAKSKKANGTRRTSQAVPHPSTIRALRCLTSEFGWDRVHSAQYGRWRKPRVARRLLGLFLKTSRPPQSSFRKTA